jgi:hypothetical protein
MASWNNLSEEKEDWSGWDIPYLPLVDVIG